MAIFVTYIAMDEAGQGELSAIKIPLLPNEQRDFVLVNGLLLSHAPTMHPLREVHHPGPESALCYLYPAERTAAARVV